MFLNFPVMDMNRSAIWKNPERVPQDGVDRMNRYWGDASWKEAAYRESQQTVMFGSPEIVKQENEEIAAAFQARLRKVAGFEFVPDPVPMKNKKNAGSRTKLGHPAGAPLIPGFGMTGRR
jgi:hypothetical protein